MQGGDPDINIVGRKVIMWTVLCAAAFALSAYVLVS